MVGMPVFIDQKDVLKRMEEKGVGLGVPKGAPSDQIHAAIVKVGEMKSVVRPRMLDKKNINLVCVLLLKHTRHVLS